MKLKKDITFLGVFSIAAGSMISSGLFVLPGFAFAKAGPAVVLSYILAGLLVLPALFAKAELLSAMPKAGGDYFYISRGMGILPGFLGGISNWFSLCSKSAFALVGIGAFAGLVIEGITERHIDLIASIFCILFTIINLKGVKLTETFQIIMVLFLIAVLLFFVGSNALNLNLHHYGGFFNRGFRNIVATAGFVFVSFAGLTKVASVAEEVKDPAKNIPLGMIVAWGVVLILYGLAIFTVVGLLEAETLSKSLTPLTDAVKSNFSKIVITFGAMLAFITTANAGILSASRGPYMMSKDELLPLPFQNLNKKNVPWVTILLSSFFMLLMIWFLNIENLVKVASSLLLILYILAVLTLILMREGRILNYRPTFKAPLYPYIYIAGVVFYVMLLLEMGSVALETTVLFLAFGTLGFFFFAYRKEAKKTALIHVVERIIGREIVEKDTLGYELREVLKERDKIVEDRFDRIVKESIILDLEGRLSFEKFLNIVCDKFVEETSLEKEELLKHFQEREKDSSTIIRRGLAVPHIIVNEKNLFKMILIRAKEGIEFPSGELVKTVFCIIASADERNFYLRSLMAIAEIVQEADFEEKWLNARNKRELEDIILLASRKRDEVLK